jgi:hypothetical protein
MKISIKQKRWIYSLTLWSFVFIASWNEVLGKPVSIWNITLDSTVFGIVKLLHIYIILFIIIAFSLIKGRVI